MSNNTGPLFVLWPSRFWESLIGELRRTPWARSSQNMALPRSRRPAPTRADNTSGRYYPILMFGGGGPCPHVDGYGGKDDTSSPAR